MPYVKDIIPPKKKVLDEHFQRLAEGEVKRNIQGSIPRKILAIFLFIIMVGTLWHMYVSVLLGMAGLLIWPRSKAWIEQKLVFHLTLRISIVIVSFLLMFAAILQKQYFDQDYELYLIEKAKAEELERERIAHQLAVQKRKDSVATFILSINQLVESRKFKTAISSFDEALKATKDEEELKLLTVAKYDAEKKWSFDLFNRGQYAQALPLFTSFINYDSDPTLYYKRAICYSYIGRIRDAVSDLRIAINSGNKDAQRLYDQLNPIKQRIAYYVTRCCDGSTSNAKGRGACSHHGGVCNWNDPVYEQYREY